MGEGVEMAVKHERGNAGCLGERRLGMTRRPQLGRQRGWARRAGEVAPVITSAPEYRREQGMVLKLAGKPKRSDPTHRFLLSYTWVLEGHVYISLLARQTIVSPQVMCYRAHHSGLVVHSSFIRSVCSLFVRFFMFYILYFFTILYILKHCKYIYFKNYFTYILKNVHHKLKNIHETEKQLFTQFLKNVHNIL